MNRFQYCLRTSFIVCLLIGGSWVHKSYGQSMPEIDGDLGEWTQEFTQVPKQNWYYALAYTDSALYVGMAILDVEIQYHILMCGLTCWLQPKGGKKQQKGIRFPVGLPEEQKPSDSDALIWYVEELSSTKKDAILAVSGLEMINFYGNHETTWGNNLREDGVQVQLGMNAGGDLLYELMIPRSIIPEYWSSDKQTKKFDIEWETGTLGRPKDIRGQDAIGISGGATSNPYQPGGESLRSIHAKQDQYRAYAKARKAKIKGLILK